MATSIHSNPSTKVIRIQDEEKELLSRLREIYGNDYKKYGEYIRRESDVPLSIKKIYKLLDERKAYRRISDYFHRERAAKKVKDSHSNGINGSYTRSSNRGISQVPEQISSLHLDHEMDDEDDLEHHNEQDQPSNSPSETNISDEVADSSILNSNQQRKEIFPLTNHKYPSNPSLNEKSDLLAIRSHLEKALQELDRTIISKSEQNDDDRVRSMKGKSSNLTNGHRSAKLDEIVRSLSYVVNQQQENTRSIIDQSSVLLLDNDEQPNEKISSDSQESLRNILLRLNALVDRGNSIYDRVESILSEL